MDRPLLKPGSSGPAVQELKKLLNQLLRPSAGLTVDNDSFGKNTFTAVERFQREQRLKVDGLVGPDTWKALLKLAGGGASGVPHDPGKPVSDGVINPEPRAPTKDELKIIHADAKLAEQYMLKARVVLSKLKERPSIWPEFRESFVGPGETVSPSGASFEITGNHLKMAAHAVSRYNQMLAAVRGTVEYAVQDSEMKTKRKWAYAYAQYGGYISFSKKRYLEQLRNNQVKRAGIMVHELAHFAWDADHAAVGVAKSGKSIDFFNVTWPEGLNGADRYEEYAVRVGS